jgi:hypothetical protein
VLPTSFQSRPHAQAQLLEALVNTTSSAAHSTSVTAPKSKISSQGSK